ncbi:Alpha/Beta hydrolase fold [Naviculisporaceae sp. PSN 640]
MADNEGRRRRSSLKAIFFLPRFTSATKATKLTSNADIEEGSHEDENRPQENDRLPIPKTRQQPRRYSLPTSETLRRTLIILLGIVLIISLSWHLGYFPHLPRYIPHPTDPEPPLVNLNYTIYQGERLPSGINRFLGMRYAAPPLGDLRFRAPVEPPPYPRNPDSSGKPAIKQATRFRPICLSAGRGYPYGDQSEDCLFVNVWSPADAIPGKSNLPVWVFISGGGYNSLANANWNGEGVVKKSGGKIVFVNFNYRVGMWGFLASEKVRRDGDLNVGLLDQRMLSRWVKKYIAEFGGDPNHVVIHGASAGAGSVAMHMIAYGGRDDKLFAGVMSESVFFPAQPRVSEVEYQFDRVLRYTGCDSAPESQQLSCLRRQDVTLLQAANHAQPFPGRPDPPNPLFYWTPCIDGDFLQDLPYRMFEDGRFIDVPVLAGTATDEGSVFAPNTASREGVANFFANNYPNLTPLEMDSIFEQYPKREPPLPRHAEWYPTASWAYGEATFICPNVNIMNVLSVGRKTKVELTSKKRRRGHSPQVALQPGQDDTEKNSTTASFSFKPRRLFAYRYNVQDDDNLAWGLGVPHIFDAPAIFGPGNCPTARSYWTYNAPIVPIFMSYHISFVRSLDPNTHREEGSPVWETWGGKGKDDLLPLPADNKNEDDRVLQRKPSMRRLVVETGNTRMEEVSEAELRRCEFWLGLGDVLEQL